MRKVTDNFNVLAIIFCLCFLIVCSTACGKSGQSGETQEVVFDDTAKSANKNEVVIEDASSGGGEEKQVLTFGEKKPDTLLKASDNSEISTMYDGYGNKIETRRFSANSRINNLVVQTTADGTVDIKIYGQSGETAKLTPEMAERALTANGDEIANLAHINGTRADRPMQTTVRSLPPQMQSYPNYPAQRMPQTNAETLDQSSAPENPAAERETVQPQAQNPAPSDTKTKPESTPPRESNNQPDKQ